ncbi:hypothetical protein DNTS_006713 [Danionella cerebrum]|uniref:C2H2-type domain-containing protein n=1 Tax=Danionella cerebrum TaxID=2873325 RepID=A0A553RM68_9TELE|nr:hypothetical protein DNTS_006713 [Danionella translucida]
MAIFCLLCGKRFQTQTALQQHMEVHAGVRSYICSECNRTFPSHTALKRHLRSHTGHSSEMMVPPASINVNSGATEAEREARLCVDVTIHRVMPLALRQSQSGNTSGAHHVNECWHPLGLIIMAAPLLPLQCASCRPGLSCLCCLVYPAGDHPFECEFCGSCFRDESTLKGHKRIHTGEKPYECNGCGKKFSLKHQLETHYRVHTGEKPFECKLCHQRSRDYSAMIKHLRTHNGASPYQCTICLEYCPSLSAMQKHMKSHKPEDIPPDWRIEKTYLYLCYV